MTNGHTDEAETYRRGTEAESTEYKSLYHHHRHRKLPGSCRVKPFLRCFANLGYISPDSLILSSRVAEAEAEAEAPGSGIFYGSGSGSRSGSGNEKVEAEARAVKRKSIEAEPEAEAVKI